MQRLLLTLIPLALAACAAAPAEKDVAVAAVDKDTICEREARTGTSFAKVVCRTAEQRKAEQDAVTRQEESRRNFPGVNAGK